MRRFLVAAVLAWHAGAFAQAQPVIGVPLALQVERLAPQLVAFAGSRENFQNLVNGLATGSPVTLVTLGADGTQQSVTFTPNGGPMSAPDIARTLESARQQLIGNGIVSPSAQQLGAVLAGGLLLSTPNAAAGGTTPPTSGARNTSDSALPRNTSDSILPRNTSDSTLPRNTSDTPQLGQLPQVTPAPVTPPAAIVRNPARAARPAIGAAAPLAPARR